MDHQSLVNRWGDQLQRFLYREKQIRTSPVWRAASAKLATLALSLHAAGDIDRLLRLDDSIAVALDAPSVRLSRQRSLFVVEIPFPRSLWTSVSWASLAPYRKGGLAVPLGLSPMNQAIGLRLDDPRSPHVLVGGATGAGKSSVIQVIVLGLLAQNAPADLGLVLIDLKRRPLQPFADASHLVHPVIGSVADALGALRACEAEMDRRARAGGAHPYWLIVIDELADLVLQTGGANGEAAQSLQRLVSQGREHHLAVLAGVQHATTEVVGGGLARANFPVRLTGAVENAEASRLITGQAGLNAHRLLGSGDFLLVKQGEDPQRVQVALPAPDDFARLPRASSGRRLELAAPSAPELDPRADPLDPAIVADILARRRRNEAAGITRLAQANAIGAAKAARHKAFAADLETALHAAGLRLELETP